MNRSIHLISIITLGSSAIYAAPVPATAMSLAYDCFDRNTEQLVARSAIDMTSLKISCLPVPGGNLAANPSSDDDVIEISNNESIDDDFENADTSEDDFDDEDFENADASEDDFDDEDFEDEDFEDEAEGSTGDRLGQAVGEHLGKLLGKGLRDLFR